MSLIFNIIFKLEGVIVGHTICPVIDRRPVQYPALAQWQLGLDPVLAVYKVKASRLNIYLENMKVSHWHEYRTAQLLSLWWWTDMDCHPLDSRLPFSLHLGAPPLHSKLLINCCDSQCYCSGGAVALDTAVTPVLFCIITLFSWVWCWFFTCSKYSTLKD